MGVYESLGLEPIINACGAPTRLGGAPMPRAVLEAFNEAAGGWVPLEQLQAAASKVIAQVTGAEAGLVTAGSAAGLTLGAAAVLTRFDLGKMERLPHCEGFAPIYVGHGKLHEGKLVVHPLCLTAQDAETVGRRLLEELQR